MLPQVVARMARMEAWNVCVRATGATVTRRLLFALRASVTSRAG
jgi:hypothetical protein